MASIAIIDPILPELRSALAGRLRSRRASIIFHYVRKRAAGGGCRLLRVSQPALCAIPPDRLPPGVDRNTFIEISPRVLTHALTDTWIGQQPYSHVDDEPRTGPGCISTPNRGRVAGASETTAESPCRYPPHRGTISDSESRIVDIRAGRDPPAPGRASGAQRFMSGRPMSAPRSV